MYQPFYLLINCCFIFFFNIKCLLWHAQISSLTLNASLYLTNKLQTPSYSSFPKHNWLIAIVLSMICLSAIFVFGSFGSNHWLGSPDLVVSSCNSFLKLLYPSNLVSIAFSLRPEEAFLVLTLQKLVWISSSLFQFRFAIWINYIII